MIPTDLADQVRSEVERLKAVQADFLQTYTRLCVHYGGDGWPRNKVEMVFHRVRQEIIPVMEQLGMDPRSVQALCSWAEREEIKR
jgi:hypothetical protein